MRARPGALLAHSVFPAPRLSRDEILRRKIIDTKKVIEALEIKLEPIEKADNLARHNNLQTLMAGMQLGLPSPVIVIVLTYDVICFGNQSPAAFRLYAQIAPFVVELDRLREERDGKLDGSVRNQLLLKTS
jgi:hypothetical protein